MKKEETLEIELASKKKILDGSVSTIQNTKTRMENEKEELKNLVEQLPKSRGAD